jgi:hypothetical protein
VPVCLARSGLVLALADIRLAVNSSLRPDVSRMSPEEVNDYLARTTHCSAMVKVTPGGLCLGARWWAQALMA